VKVVKQGQKRPALLTQILEDEGWKKYARFEEKKLEKNSSMKKSENSF